MLKIPLSKFKYKRREARTLEELQNLVYNFVPGFKFEPGNRFKPTDLMALQESAMLHIKSDRISGGHLIMFLEHAFDAMESHVELFPGNDYASVDDTAYYLQFFDTCAKTMEGKTLRRGTLAALTSNCVRLIPGASLMAILRGFTFARRAYVCVSLHLSLCEDWLTFSQATPSQGTLLHRG
jgi:hypothetical protein